MVERLNEDLLAYFTGHYFPKEEVMYRLPVSLSIGDFWPELLAHRKAHAVHLPLPAAKGCDYWYVPTDRLLEAGDRLSALARTDVALSLPREQAEDGIVDEAYFSSAIEGAYTTRQQAHAFLRSGLPPQNRAEQMIRNNYDALRFGLEHLDMPLNEAAILEVARLLTEGTLEGAAKHGYRDADVHVVSGRQEIVYTAPDAGMVRPMMDALLLYLNDAEIHPIIKACVAHIYFVTVHPLFDGNGRTARALSYWILLRAGYSFFRQFPISGVLARERARYYKAIRAAQDPENGNDLTYFLEYYVEMLERSVEGIHDRLAQTRQLSALKARLGDFPGAERILRGAQWMVQENIPSITAEKWRVKLKVSFETARQDLQRLAQEGFVALRVSGRRHFYDRVQEKTASTPPEA